MPSRGNFIKTEERFIYKEGGRPKCIRQIIKYIPRRFASFRWYLRLTEFARVSI
jgi:hypothetical protein